MLQELFAIASSIPGPLLCLLLVLLGLCVGILGAFFGVGGGWMITPTLNILGLPMPSAVGTGIAYATGMSAMAAFRHRKLGNVDLRLGMIIPTAMVIGVEIGKRLGKLMEDRGLADVGIRYLYMIVLAIIAFLMFRDYLKHNRRGDAQDIPEEKASRAALAISKTKLPPLIHCRVAGVRHSLWTLAAVGLIGGIFVGLMGVGGGIFLVPALIYLIGCRTSVAVGTSLVAIMVSGTYGTLRYGMDHKVIWAASLLMIVGAALGVHMGAAVSKRVQGYKVRLLFASCVAFGALSVLFKQLGLGRAAMIVILATIVISTLIVISTSFLQKRQGATP